MDKNDLLLEQWKMTSELHRHEDALIWQKFNYFIAMNSILLTTLAIIWSKDVDVNQKLVSVVISLFGMIVSPVWFFIQRRGHLYQNYRIFQAKKVEQNLQVGNEQVLNVYAKGLDETEFISTSNYPFLKQISRLSAQKLALFLGEAVTVIWVLLFLYHLFLNPVPW